MRKTSLAVILFATCGLAASAAATEAKTQWPDNFLTRVELLALLETLNANLLASRSATLTLEKWCADHKMAQEPKVTAERVSEAEKPASAETRRRLRVGPEEPLKYRRVRLTCGGHILSEADNWYAPSRLPKETNALLETTDTPFGKAVQALQPSRRTVEARMRWSPLPEGWEIAGPGSDAASGPGKDALDIPREILEHRAVLYSKDETPISEVDETYTSELLDWQIFDHRQFLKK